MVLLRKSARDTGMRGVVLLMKHVNYTNIHFYLLSDSTTYHDSEELDYLLLDSSLLEGDAEEVMSRAWQDAKRRWPNEVIILSLEQQDLDAFDAYKYDINRQRQADRLLA
jgi:hypothetical protein